MTVKEKIIYECTCDRCGEFIVNDYCVPPSWKKVNVCVTESETDEYLMSSITEKFLCPDCIEDLKETIREFFVKSKDKQ